MAKNQPDDLIEFLKYMKKTDPQFMTTVIAIVLFDTSILAILIWSKWMGLQ